MSLTPADPDRCQAEKPNGANAFTMGGVPEMVRCTEEPVSIVHETVAGCDGKLGSMSLCAGCLVVFTKQMADFPHRVEEIER